MNYLIALITSVFGNIFKTAITTTRNTYSAKRYEGKIKITVSTDRVLNKYRNIGRLRDSSH